MSLDIETVVSSRVVIDEIGILKEQKGAISWKWFGVSWGEGLESYAWEGVGERWWVWWVW